MSENLSRSFGIEDGQRKAYVYISSMLHQEGYSLSAFPNMLQIIEIKNIPDDRTVWSAQPETLSNCEKLNVNQLEVVDIILNSVENEGNNSNCGCIDGPGGSGKTFIHTTLCHLLKTKN